MNDREAEKICERWFVVDERRDYDDAKLFHSKKIAITKEEAWEKTFAKWYLKAKGYKPIESIETCGLCDMYWTFDIGCDPCPIYLYTEKDQCAIEQYHKAVGHDFGVKKAINILEFISFLCKIARNEANIIPANK